jgi:hypothetical protein
MKPVEFAAPLQWPRGWKRTPLGKIKQCRFKDKSRLGIIRDLESELRLLGGDRAIVTCSAWAINRDGSISAKTLPQSADQAVAVYFERLGRRQCIPCDVFPKHWQNLHAIVLAIGAMRQLERYGTTEIMERAFEGFAALEAQTVPERQWDEVLQITGDSFTWESVRLQYVKLAKERHPDNGGSNEQMTELNLAWEKFCTVWPLLEAQRKQYERR